MNVSFNKELICSKNLLAFSAGIDSTALFFLLVKNDIPFDIAIVNYNLRKQSLEEINYAKELANIFNKNIFIKNVILKSISNFEKNARDIRYNFLENVINENNYDTLLTAHQLNDKLEWFLMQLSKGAGLIELFGLNEFEQKDNYKIYRPLLDIKKNDLEAYLIYNKIKYFIDETNYDEKYKRNFFRNKFANDLINNFGSGIKKSFEYLQNDIISLNLNTKPLKKVYDLEIFRNLNDENLNIRIIDIYLKKAGFLISSSQRKEILRQKNITISSKINISIETDFIWICRTAKVKMNKEFKETCRINKIPKNIRPYLYEKNINPDELIF